MTLLPSLRLAAATGLAMAAAVALWWLGSTRLALDGGSDGGRSAAGALHAAWLVRAIALPIVALRVGTWHGWRAGVAAALALIAPSWPVVLLAGSASVEAWSTVVLAEALLLAAAPVLAWLGSGLRRALPRAELADLLAAGSSVALAAAVWVTRAHWAP